MLPLQWSSSAKFGGVCVLEGYICAQRQFSQVVVPMVILLVCRATVSASAGMVVVRKRKQSVELCRPSTYRVGQIEAVGPRSDAMSMFLLAAGWEGRSDMIECEGGKDVESSP